MSSSLHVVFGAGQVGAGLAHALRRRGHAVRVVRRSERPVGDGIEVVSADARDPAPAIAAAAGAAVIYHCMNPSAYSKVAWEAEFPALGEAMIAAAIANEARLVCLDNLYMYGESDEPRRPDSPQHPTGAKGRVRVRWEERLRRAADEEGLDYAVGRAGDFFGPGSGDHSFVGTDRLMPLLRGKSVLMVGRPGQVHAFSYIPDVIEGLIALAEADDLAERPIVHLPVITVAPRELVGRVADALDVSPRITNLPPWAVNTLGLVVPFLAELKENLYQWDRPFLVDDSTSRERFEVGSSLDEAVRGVAESLRAAAAA